MKVRQQVARILHLIANRVDPSRTFEVTTKEGLVLAQVISPTGRRPIINSNLYPVREIRPRKVAGRD